MHVQNKYLYMSDLIGESVISNFDSNGVVHPSYVLICLGEVQKSGAKIYFRPANKDFTCDGKTYFETYSAAYQSENW